MTCRATPSRPAGAPERLFILAAVGALAIVACSSSSSVAPEVVAAAGSYGLVSVNDSALPRAIRVQTGYLLEITEDTIVLSPNGRWGDVTYYRETSGTTINRYSNAIYGTFDVIQNTVVFRSIEGTAFSGELSGGTLTINLGAKAVYKK